MKVAKRKYPLLSQLISCYRGQKISKKKKKENKRERDLVLERPGIPTTKTKIFKQVQESFYKIFSSLKTNSFLF